MRPWCRRSAASLALLHSSRPSPRFSSTYSARPRRPTSAIRSPIGEVRSGSAFDDAHVAFDVAGAQRLERFLVGGRIVTGDGLVDAVELDQHHTFVHARLVDLCRVAAREKAAAGAFDRRYGELGVGLPGLRIFHRTIGHHPIGLRHNVPPLLVLLWKRPYCAIAFRSKARASSLPSSGRNVRRVPFQPSLPRLGSHRLAPTRWMRNPVVLPWPDSSRGAACRSGEMICKYDVATAVSPSSSTRGSPAKWQRPPAMAAIVKTPEHQAAIARGLWQDRQSTRLNSRDCPIS